MNNETILWKRRVIPALAIVFLLFTLLTLLNFNDYKHNFSRLRRDSLLRHGKIRDKRILWNDRGKDLSFQSANLTIEATSYKNHKSKSAILLLHGGCPEARKLGLYRILANVLSENYSVLTIDLRAWGESENPNLPITFQKIHHSVEIRDAIHVIEEIFPGTGDIFIIGHSMGSGASFEEAIDNPEVKKIVSIGPPRRTKERLPTDFPAFKERTERLTGLTIDDKTFLVLTEFLDIETYMPYFASESHKPILLIDGSLENRKDREFLREIYKKMSEPKQYITIHDSDHYCNTANIGPLVIYDKKCIDELIHVINNFLMS